MAKEKLSLQEQANKILEQAQEKGVQSNFFFVTTFKRYQVQMATLAKLEEAIKAYGPTVEKEYVKGRQNLVVNPAITEYNKTSTAANGTPRTLRTFCTASSTTTPRDMARASPETCSWYGM